MFFPAVLSLAVLLLQTPQTASRDGLTLLKEVGERYVNANSYRIEAIEGRHRATSCGEAGGRPC